MRHAFTIVELTVTICILGVISAIAMPSVGKLLDSIHIRGAVLEIESLFSGARHIAIARSAQATVDIDTVDQAIYVSVGVDTLRKREIGKDHGVRLSATRVRMSTRRRAWGTVPRTSASSCDGTRSSIPFLCRDWVACGTDGWCRHDVHGIRLGCNRDW